jgi:predicted nucleic acid-binding protein
VKSILIDTSAYVAFKRGQPDAIAVVRSAPAIEVNAIVVGELLSGFAASAHDDRDRQEFEAFLTSPRVILLPLDRRTAEVYAAVYRALRSAGTPIPTNDMWIAASAIQHGLALFTYDRHFGAVAGLRAGKSLPELS